jgi:cytosine/adenosine deaminase-related metal-dependent hydrolase
VYDHPGMLKLNLALLAIFSLQAGGQEFDTAIVNGRVLDPETGLDAARSIGIRGGRIAAISANALHGKTVIDARGLVVAPGFIDLHSHGQTPENYRFKARDGVTTALELEVGVWPVPSWYAAREGKALINFGASSGHIPASMAVLHDPGNLLPRGEAATRAPTPDEQREILAHIKQGLDDGALGVGIGIAYVPRDTREQILEVFQLAAAYRRPCFIHMRNGGPVEPGVVDALQEVLADAAATGAPLHIVHITSMALGQTPLSLNMIRGAKNHGLDVTTEAYSYTAGMTDISSAVFNPGWQQHQGGITYHDLQWAATGERLTEESFQRYRQQGGMVAIHSIPETMVKLAMSDPAVMIASDGILENGKGHPRAAGCYARVLGRYVREQHALSLMDAVRKMTLLPAKRLGLQNKGRIRIGADADLTIFDPARVIDRATFENPAQYSEGIPYVLVNGVLIVKNGALEEENVMPGRGVRRQP